MRATEDADLQSIRKSHKFAGIHAAQLPGVTETGVYITLGELLETIDGRLADQTSAPLAARGATAEHKSLHEKFVDFHIRPIVNVADVLIETIQGMSPITMPPANYRGMRLVGYGRGIAQTASKYKEAFVKLGLPNDFVERLDEAARELESAVAEPIQHKAHGWSTTEALRREIKLGRKLLKALNTFVQNAAADNPVLLAEWKAVKRVDRPRKNAVAVISAPASVPMLEAPAPKIKVTAKILSEEPLAALVKPQVAADKPQIAPARGWSLRRLLPGFRN